MTADDADEFARHATAAGYEAPGSYARGVEEGRAERDKRVRPCARCGDRLVVGTASSLTCCDTCALAIADEVHTGATETAREEGRAEVMAAVEAVADWMSAEEADFRVARYWDQYAEGARDVFDVCESRIRAALGSSAGALARHDAQVWDDQWGTAVVAPDGFINPSQVSYANSREGAVYAAPRRDHVPVHRQVTDWKRIEQAATPDTEGGT